MNSRAITTLIVFVLTVILASRVAMYPHSLSTLLLLAVVVTVYLVLHPRLLVMMTVGAGVAGLKLPVMGNMNLQPAMFGILALYGLILASMRKDNRARDLSESGLILFSMALGLAIVVHGMGMAILGSESYGGRVYIELFFAIVAYWGAKRIELDQTHVRWLVYGYAGAALIPLAAQAVVFLKPGAYAVLERFIVTHADYLLAGGDGFRAGNRISEEARWNGAGIVAGMLWMMAMGWYGLTRKHVRLILCFMAALIMVLMSGFRGGTTTLIIVSAIALITVSRNRMGKATAILVFGGIAYIALLLIGPMLPWAMQRALTFVPGVDWSTSAVTAATGSLDWRFEVWRVCAQHLSEHLLIGRGLLLENVYTEHAWMQAAYYNSPAFYYASHGYHSGPLSLLLDTGVLGFVGFILFQVGVLANGFRYWFASAGATNLFLRGILLALVIRTSFGLLSYYLLFGDIIESLPQWIVTGILIRAVGETLVRDAKDVRAKSLRPVVDPASQEEDRANAEPRQFINPSLARS